MRHAQWIVAVALAAFLIAGCNKEGDTKTSDASKAGKTVRLAFVTNNAAEFWTIAKAGCDKAVKDLGNVTLEYRVGDGTAADQKRLLDDLLVKGVDGIAISPIDPANQIAQLNEVAKKAVLVTHDSDAADSNRAFYVGTDNFAAGVQAGELIKKVLPDGGKVMVFVGSMDAQNAKDRFGGIKKAIEGSKVEVIDVRTDGTDQARAKSNAVDALVKYPDIACMVGLWNYNGPAILNAVKDANKVGTVKIVCFDENEETLQGVKDGAIFGTVVQQPFEFGYQAITLMNKLVGGDKSFIPAGKQIIVPTLQINKENVDEFWTRLNKLRGK